MLYYVNNKCKEFTAVLSCQQSEGAQGMSIKKYETLLKTVDLGSLTRASEALGYTQSAISHIISGLEEEMGLRLLIRDRSGVRLTEEGGRLLPAIRAVCQANQEVHRQVSEIHGLEVGVIRMGTFLSVSVHILPNLIAKFSEQHPHLEFELLQGSYTDIERWISEGRVECGFVRLPTNQALETIPVLEESILAVFPKERELELKQGRFPVEKISEETFILRPDALEASMRSLMKRSYCKPRITYSAKDDLAVIAMVEKGLGMSILPELLLRGNCHNIRMVELDPPAHRKICVAYKSDQMLCPAARQFLSFIREEMGGAGIHEKN